MANGHGGKRTPAHPAVVSGPGALSARTDGGPTKGGLDQLGSGQYGQSAALQQAVQGAPVRPPSMTGAQGAPMDMSGVTPLNAPTQQPYTPVTAGADAGPGPSSQVLGLNDPSQMDVNNFRRYLPILIQEASRDTAPDSFKQAIRLLAARS